MYNSVRSTQNRGARMNTERLCRRVCMRPHLRQLSIGALGDCCVYMHVVSRRLHAKLTHPKTATYTHTAAVCRVRWGAQLPGAAGACMQSLHPPRCQCMQRIRSEPYLGQLSVGVLREPELCGVVRGVRGQHRLRGRRGGPGGHWGLATGARAWLLGSASRARP